MSAAQLEEVLVSTGERRWTPKTGVECRLTCNPDGTWHGQVEDALGCAWEGDDADREEAARMAHYIATGDEGALDGLTLAGSVGRSRARFA